MVGVGKTYCAACLTSETMDLARFSAICATVRDTAGTRDKMAYLDGQYRTLASADDLVAFISMLATDEDKRVYRMGAKAIADTFEHLLDTIIQDQAAADGDTPAFVAREVFVSHVKPPTADTPVPLAEVRQWLDALPTLTVRATRQPFFAKVVQRVRTQAELEIFLRLIMKDLKIHAATNLLLKALHPDALAHYRQCASLEKTVRKFAPASLGEMDEGEGTGTGPAGDETDAVVTGTFVKPMLAKPLTKVPTVTDGSLLAEIKLDGERIQVHKQGADVQCWSRNGKPMPASKVGSLLQHLGNAIGCASGIFDGEILVYDPHTEAFLPFGTLGKHKMAEHPDAHTCVVLFDVMAVDGASTMHLPFVSRRTLLDKFVRPEKGRVHVSAAWPITSPEIINDLWALSQEQRLEGLMIKAASQAYEPGARHWSKLKKDYQTMADTVDLVVLGAYHGTGKKGGMLSSFLLGIYDSATQTATTVCKCANGLSDAVLMQVQTDIPMQPFAPRSCSWLSVDTSLRPDYVVADPAMAPVWEIKGAEFTKSPKHTAGGISVRFPRVVKFRPDKDPASATTLAELQQMAQ